MAGRVNNHDYLHGSARFATEDELTRAGMFDFTKDAIYCGKAFGKRLWMKLPGGMVVCAGARSGKLTGVLAQNILSGTLSAESLLILDPKGELAAISQNQTPDKKYCLYWNVFGLHGLPQHKINPFGHLTWSSPRLFSDIKFAMRGLLPASGSAQAKYFELNARRIAEAIAITLVKIYGVLTFPDLYDAILSLNESGQRWLDFAWEMHTSGIRECEVVEAEIANAQRDSSGGYRGIVGELNAAVSCLSDPTLRAYLSAPFDASLEDLSTSEIKHQMYFMCPVENIDDWAPVIKSYLASAKLLKSRHPQAPRQTWILDEAARLKGFEEVIELFTDGAGVGIRPILVVQDLSQLDDLGRNAERKILSSASVQMYFGIRDRGTAKHISEIIGPETLGYNDPLHQGRARVQLRNSIFGLFSGGDAFENLMQTRQTLSETTNLTLHRRELLGLDEVMRLPRQNAIVRADGIFGVIDVWLDDYFDDPDYAGLFHPNPYHPPIDKVSVMTSRGQTWLPVLTQNVPERYAHYPQYADGMWSVIEKPKGRMWQ